MNESNGDKVNDDGDVQPLIKLFPAELHDGVSLSVKLSWCIGREVLGMLDERGVRDPHILLVTARKRAKHDLASVDRYDEVGRVIAPLSDGEAYPHFPTHGDFFVIPFIVWTRMIHGFDGTIEIEPRDYLTKKQREYRVDVLSRGTISRFNTYDQLVGQPIEVSVPKDLFAKPPAKWRSWWANLWYSTVPRDQCEFRRRFWFIGVLLQSWIIPLWLVLTTVARTVTAFVLRFLIGARGVNFAAIAHPWTDDLDAVWDAMPDRNPFRSSVFVCKNVREEIPQPPFLIAFMPLVLLLAFFVSLIFVWTVGSAFVGALLFASVATAGILIYQAYPAIGRVFRKRSRSYTRREEKRPTRRTIVDELEPVVCTGTAPVLSQRPRKVHMRFADAKAKVCKPFADASA